MEIPNTFKKNILSEYIWRQEVICGKWYNTTIEFFLLHLGRWLNIVIYRRLSDYQIKTKPTKLILYSEMNLELGHYPLKSIKELSLYCSMYDSSTRERLSILEKDVQIWENSCWLTPPMFQVSKLFRYFGFTCSIWLVWDELCLWEFQLRNWCARRFGIIWKHLSSISTS